MRDASRTGRLTRAAPQLTPLLLPPSGVTRTASKLAFRPDGARLAVGTHEGAVFIFRSDEAALKTGRLVPLRRGPDDARARLPLHDCVQKIAELKYSPAQFRRNSAQFF